VAEAQYLIASALQVQIFVPMTKALQKLWLGFARIGPFVRMQIFYLYHKRQLYTKIVALVIERW
jgi:hypothetical protein